MNHLKYMLNLSFSSAALISAGCCSSSCRSVRLWDR